MALNIIGTAMLLSATFSTGCTSSNSEKDNAATATVHMDEETPLTSRSSIKEIVDHPAFKGFGELLLPSDDNSQSYNKDISSVASLMPYHNAVNPDEIVNALNHLAADGQKGETIFYDIYSEQQKKQDPAKKMTGLFFFRGDPGAPFAIVCPGGGFSYVGSLHEGLPLASAISKKRLNAFVIRYRIGDERMATEDLANAIKFIIANAAELEVDTDNYSLWGGSAGARMVGNIAYYGLNQFVPGNFPQPATAVIAYTGHSLYSNNFPPTFLTVSADDGIANALTVDRRYQNLRNAGITVSYERYNRAGHGFGMGTGTDAEGWLQKAVDFWKIQMINKA